MKNTISLFFLCFILLPVWGQNKTVEYQYDVSGNIKSRKTIPLTRSAQEVPGKDSTAVVYEDVIDKKEIRIYPNPTSGVLYIKINNFQADKLLDMTLFDLNGRIYLNQPLHIKTTMINISRYPKGIYILRLQSGIIHSEWKIIKRD